MLRVSDVWERALHAPASGVARSGEVVVIRSGGSYDGKQGMNLAAGVSSRSAGARALCLHLVTIPPGTRGVPHVHDGHESAIYTVSGETEVWHGQGLMQRTVVRAGDFMYVPPGIPHLPVNRSDVVTVAVVARTDPQEQESVVTMSLPPHLAELDDFPVASPLRGQPASLDTAPARLPRLRAPPPPQSPERGNGGARRGGREQVRRRAQSANASGGGHAQTRFLSP